jgi:hypothetical protein
MPPTMCRLPMSGAAVPRVGARRDEPPPALDAPNLAVANPAPLTVQRLAAVHNR